jgi:hypothetical protein
MRQSEAANQFPARLQNVRTPLFLGVRGPFSETALALEEEAPEPETEKRSP